jgi:hypothetical protein
MMSRSTRCQRLHCVGTRVGVCNNIRNQICMSFESRGDGRWIGWRKLNCVCVRVDKWNFFNDRLA